MVVEIDVSVAVVVVVFTAPPTAKNRLAEMRYSCYDYRRGDYKVVASRLTAQGALLV